MGHCIKKGEGHKTQGNGARKPSGVAGTGYCSQQQDQTSRVHNNKKLTINRKDKKSKCTNHRTGTQIAHNSRPDNQPQRQKAKQGYIGRETRKSKTARQGGR
jgi:hypothetical protein